MAQANANTTHYRNTLNNHAQRTGKTVAYQDFHSGPQQTPTWTSTVYLNGVQYGIGDGPTKAAAQEKAAGAAIGYIERFESP